MPDKVSFLDPEDTMSEDGMSCGNSETSGVTTVASKRRRSNRRSSTSYYLAHPAPTLTQKQRLVHIRPKLLLQYQRLSADARPMPVIDVLSSSTFVPRLAKKFPRIFKERGELGFNDVMVVKSENYDVLDEELETTTASEGPMDREILAVICQIRNLPGTSEICFADGSRWFASPVTKGMFELVRTDPITCERTVARWVCRGTSRRSSFETPSRGSEARAEQKYQFSILNPDTRRHPVLASLTQGTLNIPDTYTAVSHKPRTPTSPLTSSEDGEQLDIEAASNRTICTLSDYQKLLIQVSGIWVALRLGWSPLFKYSDASPTPNSSPKSTDPSPVSSTKSDRPRSVSLTPSIGSRSKDNRRNTLSGAPDAFDAMAIADRLRCKQGFARHSSTGSAFMDRIAARRLNRPPSLANSEAGSAPPSPKRVSLDTIERSSVVKNDISSPTSPSLPRPVPLFKLTTIDSEGLTKTVSLQAATAPSGIENVPPKKAYRSTNSHLEGTTSSPLRNHREAEPKALPAEKDKPKGGKWRCLLGVFRRHGTRAH
jgi:hypothetical protein